MGHIYPTANARLARAFRDGTQSIVTARHAPMPVGFVHRQNALSCCFVSHKPTKRLAISPYGAGIFRDGFGRRCSAKDRNPT